jgi:hypothetical protein
MRLDHHRSNTRREPRVRSILRRIALLVVLAATTPFDAQISKSVVPAPDAGSVAEKYLEELQREALQASGAPLRKHSSTDASDVSDAVIERLLQEEAQAFHLSPSEIAAERQRIHERTLRFRQARAMSPYEDPELYRELVYFSARIETAIRKNPQPHDVLDQIDIALGTLPTGEVNAVSIAVPDHKQSFVIAFESGLFPFAELMSTTVADALPIESEEHGYAVLIEEPDEVRRYILQHPAVQERYQRVLLTYLTEGRVDTLEQSYSDASDVVHQAVATGLYMDMALFVIGHEYGHVVRGDLSDSGSELISRRLNGHLVQSVEYDWEKEYGADALGIEFTYLALRERRYNLAAILEGADFFLRCIEVTEQGATLIATGSVRALPGGDHPPSSLRRAKMRNALHAFLDRFYPGEVSQQQWATAVKEASNMDQITGLLFDGSQTYLRKQHERGLGLAPAWQQRLDTLK